MSCIFCFGKFNNSGEEIGIDDWKKITDNIALAFKGESIRITLAGGEPLLFKEIGELIDYIHGKGMKVALITNGQLLNEGFLADKKDKIDTIGISIDSLVDKSNLEIGRACKGIGISRDEYIEKCQLIKSYGIGLKINTVVNSLNYKESMLNFLEITEPDKWKVFNMLLLDGENNNAKKYKVSEDKFTQFIENHKKYQPVIEDNEDMIGSYITISPGGVLVDNSSGKYIYSNSLVDSNFLQELERVNFNWKSFSSRYE